MNTNLKDIGSRIRAIRKRCGDSQASFGQRINVGATTVSKYENGESDAGAVTLAKISEIGGVSLDYLLTGRKTSEDVLSTKSPAEREKINSVINPQDKTTKVIKQIHSSWKNEQKPTIELEYGAGKTAAGIECFREAFSSYQKAPIKLTAKEDTLIFLFRELEPDDQDHIVAMTRMFRDAGKTEDEEFSGGERSDQ